MNGGRDQFTHANTPREMYDSLNGGSSTSVQEVLLPANPTPPPKSVSTGAPPVLARPCPNYKQSAPAPASRRMLSA